MFFTVVLLIVLSAVFPAECPGQGTPHLVFGEAINSQLHPCPQVVLSAWLAAYEDDVISGQFADGIFEVEVSDFDFSWQIGDELMIALTDPLTEQVDTLSLILTESSWQNLGFVHLESTGIRLDNLVDAEMEVGDTETLTVRIEYLDNSWSVPICENFELLVSGNAVTVVSPCLIEAVVPGESTITASIFGATANINRTVVGEEVLEQQGTLPGLFDCSSVITGPELQLWVNHPLELSVYDLLGRLLLQQSIGTTGILQLDISLRSGTYLLAGRSGATVQTQLVCLVH